MAMWGRFPLWSAQIALTELLPYGNVGMLPFVVSP